MAIAVDSINVKIVMSLISVTKFFRKNRTVKLNDKSYHDDLNYN